MHTRTKRKQKPLASTFRYTLPQDIFAVKKAAFSAALCDLYKAARRGTLHLVSGDAIHLLAVRNCQQFEQHPLGGLRGTNDPRLFREVFIPTYNRAAEAMRRLLSTSDEAKQFLDAQGTLEAIVTYLYHYTERLSTDTIEAAYMGYVFDLPPLS
jgi:hypothetical protein